MIVILKDKASKAVGYAFTWLKNTMCNCNNKTTTNSNIFKTVITRQDIDLEVKNSYTPSAAILIRKMQELAKEHSVTNPEYVVVAGYDTLADMIPKKAKRNLSETADAKIYTYENNGHPIKYMLMLCKADSIIEIYCKSLKNRKIDPNICDSENADSLGYAFPWLSAAVDNTQEKQIPIPKPVTTNYDSIIIDTDKIQTSEGDILDIIAIDLMKIISLPPDTFTNFVSEIMKNTDVREFQVIGEGRAIINELIPEKVKNDPISIGLLQSVFKGNLILPDKDGDIIGTITYITINNPDPKFLVFDVKDEISEGFKLPIYLIYKSPEEDDEE